MKKSKKSKKHNFQKFIINNKYLILILTILIIFISLILKKYNYENFFVNNSEIDNHKIKNNNLFFIHIPKNAGTSIENFGKKHNLIWGRHFDFNTKKCHNSFCCSKWHIPPKYFENNLGYEIYFKNKIPFVVVRNPYNRIVSEYLYYTLYTNLKTSVDGLNNFINELNNKKGFDNDCHLFPQSEFTFVPIIKNNKLIWEQQNENNKLIEIIKLETLDKDFPNLLKKYGYNINDKLPIDNTSKKKITKNDLTKKSIEIINKKYHDDFVNFGYDKITSI